VIPKLESIRRLSVSWRHFAEALEARQKRYFFKEVSIDTILSDTLDALAHNLTVQGRPLGGLRSDLSLFLTKKRNGAVEIIIERILNSKPQARYINETMVPLISELRVLAERHGASLTDSSLASGIRGIIKAWIGVVLGPKPILEEIRHQAGPILSVKWKCSCAPCVLARTFLTKAPTEPSVRLERIGTSKRNHVEHMLRTFAKEVASFVPIDQGVGLLVRQSA
jgi:hypothetical protein